MRTASIATAAILLAAVAACAQPDAADTTTAVAPASESAADVRDEVLRFRDEHMTSLIDRRDMDRILSHFADGATYLPPNRAAVVGKEAIRAYLADFFSRALHGVRFDNHAVEVSGDLAVLRDSYQMVVIPHSGTQSQHTGEDVWVLRRVDGDWRILTVIWTETASPADP